MIPLNVTSLVTITWLTTFTSPYTLPGGRPRKHDMREVLDAIFHTKP